MEANVNIIMIISRLKSNSVAASSLTLHSQQIEKVSSYKYLGITITDNLSWSTHINQITSNARKIIGLIYRVFHLDLSTSLTPALYIISATMFGVCNAGLESSPQQGYLKLEKV